jgi:hypothetical protein
MKRSAIRASCAGVVLLSPVIFSPKASADTRWVCDVPGEGLVTFVSAADAARHGIETANTRAGAVFHDRFGETCHVEFG